MIEAKTHASKNTLYFHSVVEIPRRIFSFLSHEGILDFAVLYPDDTGQKPPKIPGLLLSPGM